jgi:DNA-binding response OmpR family regulator
VSAHIFIVEDDPEMRQVTRFLLEQAGHRVSEACSAEEALVEIARAAPDLVLSDIQLPGLSGVKLCELLRGEPSTAGLPLILLTVKGNAPDRVRGLQTGADDYVIKPYHPQELLARIDSVLRRVQRTSAEGAILRFKPLTLDPARRQVFLNGKRIVLRKKPYDILLFFLKHRGQLLTRQRIVAALWGDAVIVTDNALSFQIKDLRQRLGPFGRRIETLIGEGYRFNDDP